MKTHEEIKRDAQALREVSIEDLIDFTHVVHSMFPQAADLVESLLTEIEQYKRERDVAIILLRGECCACLHNEDGEPCRTKEICKRCVHNEDAWGMDLDYNWQWRGVQEVE